MTNAVRNTSVKVWAVLRKLRKEVAEVYNPKRIVGELRKLTKNDLILLTILLTTQIIAFGFGRDFSPMGWIGLVTGLVTIMSLILANRALVTTFFWGGIGAVVWLAIALSHRLIGDVSSQMYYFIMQFVGIYFWKQQMDDAGSDHVIAKKLSKVQGIVLSVATLVIYFIVLKISIKLNGTQVYLDSMLLPFGIIGQLLMTYGYRSQWFFWIAINSVNVYIWFTQIQQAASSGPAISMFVLQVVMLINSIYGTIMWMKDNGEDK